MLRSAILHVVTSLAFTGLGIAAGWRIWRPAPGPAAATAPLVNAPAISPQARKNLGIVIGELKSTPWTKIARFPATLEDSPDATLSLRAPAAGTVVDVRKRAGAMIGAAEAVVTLRADASGETISVAAPAGPPDWDVVESPMNPGVHVDAGATVAVLRDSRSMRVRAESSGADLAILLEALKNGTECEATPLLEGNGPVLKGLKLLSAANGPGDRKTSVVAEAANGALTVKDEGERGKFRTWSLRAGQRYVLRIPMETIKRTFVVPTDAVADDGPDHVVFLESGDTFLPQKVVILHRDSEVAVLDARSSGLAPGDVYVQRGAFALSLALRSSSMVMGHTHPH